MADHSSETTQFQVRGGENKTKSAVLGSDWNFIDAFLMRARSIYTCSWALTQNDTVPRARVGLKNAVHHAGI